MISDKYMLNFQKKSYKFFLWISDTRENILNCSQISSNYSQTYKFTNGRRGFYLCAIIKIGNYPQAIKKVEFSHVPLL